MPRISVLVSVLAVVLAGLLAVGRPSLVAAQEASPEAEDGGFAPLAFAMVDSLPPAPALVVLFRITYEPGASFAAPAFPGPLLGAIESGTLTARPDGEVAVTRGAATASPVPAAATPGADVTLAAGDQIVTPPGTAVTYTNTGEEPSTSLVAGVVPADTPLPTAFPPGVTGGQLAFGVATTLPAGPVAIGMARLTFPPGAEEPPSANAGGPLLAYVEGGSIAYTLASGEGQVTQAPAAAATPGAVATPGAEVAVSGGGFAFEQGGAVSGARNPGDETATVVILAIGPPEGFAEDEGTPEAGTPAP